MQTNHTNGEKQPDVKLDGGAESCNKTYSFINFPKFTYNLM